MDSLMKPARLDLDPNSSLASKEWKHWFKTFTNFLDACSDETPNKLNVLVNCITPSVYEYIEDCTTYENAISRLEGVYLKTPN